MVESMHLLAQVDPALQKALNDLVAKILDYGLILISVATVSMAFLELLKAATLARHFYHSWRLRRWMHAQSTKDVDAAAARRELLTLAVAGENNARALFDQPTEKMMGQLQSATNVALDFPGRYPNLYSFITGAPEPAAPGAAATDATASRPTPDQALWKNYVEKFERAPLKVAAESVAEGSRPPTEADAERAAANSARARVEHFVARRLDAFQTSTEYLWARLNQGVAVVGGAGVLLYLLQDAEPQLPKRLALAVAGGMIAPFAKDMVTALQALGR